MAENLINSEILRKEIQRQFGTQSAFARHLGWSRQYVSQLLTGKVNVTIAQARLISSALNMPTSRLIAVEEAHTLKETASIYHVADMEESLDWGPTVLVANQPTGGAPLLDIASLRQWSSGRENASAFDSSEERIAFIRSLQQKNPDLLPGSETIHQYKQEEKQMEEQRHAVRA